MGRISGKVAFVTGAARGQGRSHAVRLAEEGADIVAIDICDQLPTVPYPMARPEDLKETERLVEAAGGRIVAEIADVRDLASMEAAVAKGLEAFGRMDIVVANAGIGGASAILDLTAEQWSTMIDVCLTGVFHTIKAAVPPIVAADRGGSVIVTSSLAGLRALVNCGHYAAAKHGLVGLAKTLANELAPNNIRVNVICPSSVKTPMMLNDWTYSLFRPDLDKPTLDDVIDAYKSLQILDIPWVDPVDISNAVLFLASDDSRYITGITFPVDGGALAHH
jgi:(+)-trans-carveol dehydrogenase